MFELTDEHIYKRITFLIWDIERWYWYVREIRCSTVYIPIVFAIAAVLPVIGLWHLLDIDVSVLYNKTFTADFCDNVIDNCLKDNQVVFTV
jgi:hypothetical protein